MPGPNALWGRWEPAERPGSSGLKAVVSPRGEIQIKQGRKVLVRRPAFGDAPTGKWSGPATVVLSADGHWVWHFGYDDGHVLVSLLSAETLESVDSIGLKRPAYYDEEPGSYSRLEDWGEGVSLIVNDHGVLAYANSGDTPTVLYTLAVGEDGRIKEATGPRLVEAARNLLDEYLVGAAWFGDRVLIIGDINDAYLVSWPDCEKLASVVLEVPEPMQLLGDAGAAGDLVLVLAENNGYEPRLVYALDGRTLAVRGRRAPPTRAAGWLVGDRYVTAKKAWRLVPDP